MTRPSHGLHAVVWTLTGLGCLTGTSGCGPAASYVAAFPVSSVRVHLVPGLKVADLPEGVGSGVVARAQLVYPVTLTKNAARAGALGAGGSDAAHLGADVLEGGGSAVARGRWAARMLGSERQPRALVRGPAVRLVVDDESEGQARVLLAALALGHAAGWESGVTIWAGLPTYGRTAVVAAVGGWPGGLLSSATTGVVGRVAAADLAPTVLWALGLPPDPRMVGAPWATAAVGVWNGGGRRFAGWPRRVPARAGVWRRAEGAGVR